MIPSDLSWTNLNATPIQDGVLHAVFGPGVVGGSPSYYRIELRNNHPSESWTGGRLWLVPDRGGSNFISIAVASASAFLLQDSWPAISDTSLTYSQPLDWSSGLALPNLPSGRKCLIVVKRALVGETPLSAKQSRLIALGDSPL